MFQQADANFLQQVGPEATRKGALQYERACRVPLRVAFDCFDLFRPLSLHQSILAFLFLNGCCSFRLHGNVAAWGSGDVDFRPVSGCVHGYFRLGGEFFAMGLAPLSPEGGEEGLDHTGKGGGEDGSPGAEKFGSGGQGQQRDDGMQANRAANDARREYVAFNNVNEDEVTENQESNYWPLGEGNQHANHAGQNGAENGYEFEDEQENAKQHRVRNAENRHAATNKYGDDSRKQELAANIAAHHVFKNINQEGNTPALRGGRATAQPFDDPRAIDQEINAGDSREQNIHERPGYASNKGDDTTCNRTRKVRQVTGKLLRE